MKRRPAASVSNTILVLFVFFILMIPCAAYADSSWVWLTDKKPFDILPIAAAATIVIEVLAIWLIPQTGKILKTAGIVLLANMLSFLLPYFVLLITDTWYGSFNDKLNAGPNYIVGGLFLILTLFIELPVTYFLLRKDAKNKKVLVITIVVVNIATTAMVAVFEHMVTSGYYA